MNTIELNFKKALLEFDKREAEQILNSLSHDSNYKILIGEILENVLRNLGDLWEKGELALSQIYMVGKICDELIQKILPPSKVEKSNIAIVTLNDFHLLGKKIVLSILRSVGYDLIDYGHGIGEAELVEKAIKDNIKYLLVSTLMLHSAYSVKNLVNLFQHRNYPIKIMVGGAPFNFDDKLWKQVGATAMGKSPSEAISILNQWTQEDN